MKSYNSNKFSWTTLGTVLLALFSNAVNLQGQANVTSSGETTTTNPNYRLSVRDRIAITVFDEPNLGMSQGIDAKGEIKVPLIGVFRVENMTIREVEHMLEEQFVEQQILRNPIVTIDVLNYSPKEVSVLGPGIARSGQITFPPEIEKMDIVEVIALAGDFTPLANKKEVNVTRRLPNGSELVIPVNVAEMIEGRKRNKKTETLYIYPGDLIYVKETFL